MKSESSFHKELKSAMDDYVHLTYDVSQQFPKEEIYGLTSQVRRSSLSVILNYVEGFARQRKLVLKNFIEVSYGSLKESEYLILFSYKRKYLKEEEYQELSQLADRIGKMLWGIMKNL